jgi:hypothetical protein
LAEEAVAIAEASGDDSIVVRSLNQLVFPLLVPSGLVLDGLTAVLERYDEADEHFALSAAFCDRVDAKFFGARTELLWGQLLAQRSDPDDRGRAQGLLGAALTSAQQHGYVGIERRAVATVAQL